MKLIKRCLLCLLSLSMFVVLPAANVFADEDDGIMLIGQPISSSLRADDNTSYCDGTPGYSVQYKISLSYERSLNSYGKYNVKNLSVSSCTAGINDNYGPQDGSYKAQLISTNWTLYNGTSTSNAFIRVKVVVRETIKGITHDIPHYHDFYL